MTRFLLIFLCFTGMPVFAAGPVLHVYTAEKFFEIFPKYTDKEKKRFILGTLFPDIRYISELDRTHTHDEHVTIEEILNTRSPFVAGMKFHAWVDNVRDDYVLADEIYDRLPNQLTIEQKPSFLKVIEDELLLDQLDTEFCCEILEGVDSEELKQGVSEKEIRLWHAFLVFFFKTSPRTTVTLLSLVDTKRSHPSRKDIEQWTALINPAIESPVGIDHTRHLIDHITQKMYEAKDSNIAETHLMEGSYSEHIK